MFRSISNAIARTADLVTSTATSAEKVLDNANHYVGEHTKANNLIVTQNAKMRVAKAYQTHASELKEDQELSDLYDSVSEDW